MVPLQSAGWEKASGMAGQPKSPQAPLAPTLPNPVLISPTTDLDIVAEDLPVALGAALAQALAALATSGHACLLVWLRGGGRKFEVEWRSGAGPSLYASRRLDQEGSKCAQMRTQPSCGAALREWSSVKVGHALPSEWGEPARCDPFLCFLLPLPPCYA